MYVSGDLREEARCHLRLANLADNSRFPWTGMFDEGAPHDDDVILRTYSTVSGHDDNVPAVGFPGRVPPYY